MLKCLRAVYINFVKLTDPAYVTDCLTILVHMSTLDK